jgi:transposase-like protein
MTNSWDRAAFLLATTTLSVDQVAREVQVTENQICLWRADAKFQRLMETHQARNNVARLLATTNLGMRDVAFLSRVSLKTVARWAHQPDFQEVVEQHRRNGISMKDEEDEDGGEWSPTITVLHYKKP